MGMPELDHTWLVSEGRNFGLYLQGIKRRENVLKAGKRDKNSWDPCSRFESQTSLFLSVKWPH